MVSVQLIQVAVFLAAAAIAAPLGRFLRLGAVLGYLVAGIIIGPFGVGLIYSLYDVENILHFAEFGVVMLLVRDRARAQAGAAVVDALGDLRTGHGPASGHRDGAGGDRPWRRA